MKLQTGLQKKNTKQTPNDQARRENRSYTPKMYFASTQTSCQRHSYSFWRKSYLFWNQQPKILKRRAIHTYPLSNCIVCLSFCKPVHIITTVNDINRGIQPTSRRENQLPFEELSIGQNTQTFIQNQGNHELKPFFTDGNKFVSSVANGYQVSIVQFLFSSSFYSTWRGQTTSIDEAWQDSGLLKMVGKEVFSNLSAVMLGILIICYSTAMQFLILLPKKTDLLNSHPEHWKCLWTQMWQWL